MVQLRPLAAQDLSGARFVKEEHRLANVKGESERESRVQSELASQGNAAGRR